MIFLKNITFKQNVDFESRRESQSSVFKIKTKIRTVKDRLNAYHDADYNHIIPEKKVTEKTFTIFKKGLSIDFANITIIVGDNGCGKTSLIKNFIFPYDKIDDWNMALAGLLTTDKEQYRKDVVGKFVNNENRTLTFFGQPELIIVEKEIHKSSIIKQYKDRNTNGSGFLPPEYLAAIWDMGEYSNGENNLDFLESISKVNNSLIILDEPETSLSIKSQLRVCEIIRKMSETNQIILVTHSEYMMRLCANVYDFEKKKYFETEKYIQKQKNN